MEQVSSSWYGPDDGYQAETGRPVFNSLLDLPPRSVWLLQARLLVPNTQAADVKCQVTNRRSCVLQCMCTHVSGTLEGGNASDGLQMY
jgi:hypothetical protein